ncbi:MAG: T9SS type A sorting domain-containing protein [Bacteroidales bacterium]|nr:T9SS type A sorting domain-containing protein [Bacteroidales bacterium]
MKRFLNTLLAVVLGCALSAQHPVPGTTGMVGGTVTSAVTELPVYPGVVKAFKSTDSGAFPVADSTQLSETGEYLFTGLDPGRYTFRVLPGQLAQSVGIPTYLGDVVSWSNARIMEVDSAFVDTLQHINLIEQFPAHPGDRTGSMSGKVYYSESVGNKGTLAKPVTRTSVILIRRATSKGTQAESVSGHVETDGLGHYSFSDVPEGEYGLLVDIAGLPMFNTYDVSIDSGKVSSGLDFVVGNIGINTADRVDVTSNSMDRFMIFPNPGDGLIQVEFPVAGNYQVRIFNAVGQLVYNRAYSSASGTVPVDLTEWRGGVYLIQVDGDHGSGTVKYIKR